MARFSFTRHAAGDHHGGDASDAGMASPPDSSTGPGWYDSSWDLRQGLVVREGLPADAQLREWLEHLLRVDAAGLAA